MNNGSIDLSVIIPVYNEELAIGNFLKELEKIVADKNWEVIVVDDCSSDNTVRIIDQTNFKVIRHRHNKGYGASIKTGIKNAKGDWLALIDSDGQHNPNDLVHLFANINDCDMVIGKRDKKSFVDPERIIGKKLMTSLSSFLIKRKVYDLNSGLRLVKRNIISKYAHLLPNGFSASTTMTLIMLCEEYDVKWVSIVTKRRKGKSSLNIINDGYNSLILILRIISLFNPLRIFIPISLLFILIGVVYGIYKLFSVGLSFPVGGFIFIFIGVISFFCGIINDQISDLRKEMFRE